MDDRRAQYAVLRHLGVEKVRCVVGFSMGGQQVSAFLCERSLCLEGGGGSRCVREAANVRPGAPAAAAPDCIRGRCLPPGLGSVALWASRSRGGRVRGVGGGGGSMRI